MQGMHSRPKEQREAVRQLLHTVLTRDMATFNPERFREWLKDINTRFGKVGLCLRHAIGASRTVTFTVKEIRNGRTCFHFASSTRVVFEANEVAPPVASGGS